MNRPITPRLDLQAGWMPQLEPADTWCPVCSRAYFTGETRAGAEDCPVCQGQEILALLANAETKELVTYLSGLPSDYETLKTVVELYRSIVRGYFAFQLIRLGRKIETDLGLNEAKK